MLYNFTSYNSFNLPFKGIEQTQPLFRITKKITKNVTEIGHTVTDMEAWIGDNSKTTMNNFKNFKVI